LNENKRNQLKKEAAGYNLMPLLVVAGGIGLVLSLYIAYRAKKPSANAWSNIACKTVLP
jgi:hypothetical protein